LKAVYVGCCGFPVARKKYYEFFSVVELQNTFYELPSLNWARELRLEAPGYFEFTVKAWQVITHPHTSPTWKKMKKKPGGDLENYGYLKPTPENIEAFEKTIEVAKALKARVVVLQTPASMPSTESTIEQVEKFFDAAKSYVKKDLVVGWEIRGPLLHSPKLVKVLEKYDILHVVDVFRNKPLRRQGLGLFYTRLHGIGPGEVNYSYNYTDEDLERLSAILAEEGFEKAYVMFNNVKMLSNAQRFKEMASQKGVLRVF